jgi:hypothetical protein
VLLKKKSGGRLIILILIVLSLLSLTITKKQVSVIKHDLVQKIMTLNLGFSSLENLIDTGGEQSNFEVKDKILALIQHIPEIINYKFFNKKYHHIDEIDINIKYEDYLLIKKDRERAILDGVMSNPTKVKAKIQYKGKKYNAEVRLKGDLRGHWTSKYRHSLRVTLKNKKTILGFSSFSIHKPRERQHPYDYIFQSMVRDTGNLASTHKFAKISVNGDAWGVMDIEEHMTNEFIEKQNRKGSIIVRFANEEKWLYKLDNEILYSHYRLSDPFLNTHLYNKKSLKDSHNRKIFSYISNNRLANNKELYDIDSFSKAFIASLAWNNKHTLAYPNSRYYFNPYTLKLEFITTDQGKWIPINHKINFNYEFFHVLSNKLYFNNISQNLKDVSNSVFDLKKHFLYHESLFPLDKDKSIDIVINNMKEIIDNKSKYLIDPIKNRIDENYIENHGLDDDLPPLPSKLQAAQFPRHLHVRHYESGNLELYNLLPDTVTVKQILFDNNPFSDKDIIVPSYLSNPEPTIIKTPYKGIQDNKFTVNTDYQGFKVAVKNDITLVKNELNNPLLVDTTKKFDFINQLDKGVYKINSGNWQINQPIIVNGDLHVSPGANLQFAKGAYLIVKGSLTAIGEKNNPIIFKAISDSWKGIYVLNANTKSQLKNVNIFDISALEDELLKLTGSITFYKSDVDFENVKIKNVKAEDAINIVESSFSLNSVMINNTLSDGLDSDFSTGSVIYSKFSNINGDALDFSGSNVYIEKTEVNNVKDKAISAGEKSIINIEESYFNNIGVGVVSKDGSEVTLSNSSILDYKLYAAMSYIKKDFYDPPNINITNCSVSDEKAYIRQKGTKMSVNNTNIPESSISVEKLYKSEIMAK